MKAARWAGHLAARTAIQMADQTVADWVEPKVQTTADLTVVLTAVLSE